MRWRADTTFHHRDVTLRVRRPHDDSGTGPQFVLVHGIGASSRYYTRLARALAPSGGVHVLELPGFGRSPRPRRDPLSVEEHAGLVNAWVRSSGVARPVLVGHSMGVQVVVEAALQDPDLSAAVVGIGGVVDPSARTALRQGLRLGHDVLREPPATNWAVLSGYLLTGPWWYLRTLPVMLGYRLEDALPRLQVPLLLVRGTRDPIVPRPWAEQQRRLAPDSHLVEVEGAAHVAMHTHPEQVARAVLDHAREAVGRGPA